MMAPYERFAQEIIHGATVIEAANKAGIEIIEKSSISKFGVYFLCDPRNGLLFYIGKGKGSRPLAHERECRNGIVINDEKFRIIKDILAVGAKPLIYIAAENLEEHEAFDLESRLIKLIGHGLLTNAAAGSVSGDQRALTIAARLLARIKPFKEWVVERPRSQNDIEQFLYVASGLMMVRDKSRQNLGLRPIGA